MFHFEPYETSPNDELELEVAALPNQASFVIFGIAKSETAFSQVTVNGTPLDFQGPLAYELAGQRSGVRAPRCLEQQTSQSVFTGLSQLWYFQPSWCFSVPKLPRD